MSGRWVMRCAAAAAWVMVSAAATLAQSDDKKRESAGGGYNAIIDNIDMLVDNYARFLGRKYDLNTDQDAFTKQLLRDKAYAFIDKHENDLRDLFDQMFQARTGGAMSQEDLINWGKRVMPVYEEAKKMITDGNA